MRTADKYVRVCMCVFVCVHQTNKVTMISFLLSSYELSSTTYQLQMHQGNAAIVAIIISHLIIIVTFVLNFTGGQLI